MTNRWLLNTLQLSKHCFLTWSVFSDANWDVWFYPTFRPLRGESKITRPNLGCKWMHEEIFCWQRNPIIGDGKQSFPVPITGRKFRTRQQYVRDLLDFDCKTREISKKQNIHVTHSNFHCMCCYANSTFILSYHVLLVTSFYV